jgi:protein-tyrosine phosphatase
MADVLARIPASAHLDIGEETLANLSEGLMGAPAAAIETLLDALDANDGGAEGWFLANGGQRETLESLRKRLRV